MRKRSSSPEALISRTARGTKARILTETVKRPGLEFVQVDDLINGDFTEALRGV